MKTKNYAKVLLQKVAENPELQQKILVNRLQHDFADAVVRELTITRTSTEEFAAKLGVKVRYVNDLIDGQLSLTTTRMAEIAFALGRKVSIELTEIVL